MKRLVLSIAFLLFGICLVAQERGMKPVQVIIEDASVILYNKSKCRYLKSSKIVISLTNVKAKRYNDWMYYPSNN